MQHGAPDTLRVRWQGGPAQPAVVHPPVQQPVEHIQEGRSEPSKPNRCPLVHEGTTSQLFWGILAVHLLFTLSSSLLAAGSGSSGTGHAAGHLPTHRTHGATSARSATSSSLDLQDAGCLHPQGGGELTSGDDFLLPGLAPQPCAPTVANYLASQYDLDVVAVVAEVRRHLLQGCSSASRQPPRQLVVFSIDDTALSLIKGLGSSGDIRKWLGYTPPAEFAALLRAKQEAAKLPALRQVLDLYRALHNCGHALAFVTARSEGMRAATEANLAAAGYGRPCVNDTSGAKSAAAPPPRRRWSWQERRQAARSSACYTQLEMRTAEEAGVPAAVFKGAIRNGLQEDGWHISAVIGDQLSDQAGAAPPALAFKLPNPMYYVP